MRTVNGRTASDPAATEQAPGTEPTQGPAEGPARLDDPMGPMVGRLMGLASELDRLAREFDALAAGRHGAIVVDRHVPTPNGFEATAAVRALRGAGRLTPLVAMPPGAGRHGPRGYPDEAVDSGAPSDEVSIDPSVLAELGLLGDACGTEFLSGLTARFVRETRPLMVRLRAAVEAGDTVEVARNAHLVERMAGDLGGRRLAASCERLEANALSHSLSDDRADLQHVEIDYRQMTESLIRLSPSAPSPIRPVPT